MRRIWYCTQIPLVGDVQVEEVVLDLSIPDVLSESQTSQTFWRQENIRRGDTIASILNRLDVSNQDSTISAAARGSRAMRQLRPGQTVYASDHS